jgi:hypothetical protein
MYINKSQKSITATVVNSSEHSRKATIESALKKAFVHVKVTEINNSSSVTKSLDFVVLKNLEMLVNNEAIKDINAEHIKDLKKRLDKDMLVAVQRNLFNSIARNEPFKLALKEFMGQLVEMKKIAGQAENYQNTLAPTENAEMTNDELMDMRQKKKAFFAKDNMDKLHAMKDVTDDDAQQKEKNLKIQRNFPTEMATFTSYFDMLIVISDDDKVKSALKSFTETLGIELQSMQAFFTFNKKMKEPKTTTATAPLLSDVKTKDVDYAKKDNDPKIKSSKALLDELEIEDNDATNDEIVRESLEKSFVTISEHVEVWNKKTAVEIRAWAVEMRGKLLERDLPEAIAVLNRANSLITKWPGLRDCQVLSLLTNFQIKPGHGAFFEILTGEGKTAIVSLLAVLKILMGTSCVDIITSNDVLAEEGMKDRKDFYTIFNITVACNKFEKGYQSDMKECYKADVVYGTIGNFQGWFWINFGFKISHDDFHHFQAITFDMHSRSSTLAVLANSAA